MPADAHHGVNLKYHLLRRVTVFALVIALLAVVSLLYQARENIRFHIERTGGMVGRLIDSEAVLPRGEFGHSLGGLELSSLDGVGPLLGICVAVENIYKISIANRCFSQDADPPAAVRWVVAHLPGMDISYRGVIGQYPGYKVGDFVVTPNLDSMAWEVWFQLRTVLWMTLGILGLNLLIYWPVQRALEPADQILAVLERMEAGDLSARMPRPRLIELHRIAAGFDHLAERLQKTMAEQRHLAQRLLAVREEERRYLARELHDEFGQCLTSMGADAAFVTQQAQAHQPQLLPAAQSMAAVTAQMMESLQGILGQLRPVGLEEFGLQATLEQLISGWQRRAPGCGFALHLDGDVDDLPADLTISLYRIAQESLTNALRHGNPSQVTLHLRRTATHCRLTVDDNGEGKPHNANASASAKPSVGSGLGVLGMNERVAALGGEFEIAALSPQGMRVRAEFPAQAMKSPESV